MALTKYTKGYLRIITSVAILLAPVGCGDDSNTYDAETLTIENPVAGKRTDKRLGELNLSESSKSDFGVIGGPFGFYPWTFPLFDYYTDFVPFAVPVNPGLALIEPVHPFYAYRIFNPFWSDDDDRRFNDDDDRSCDD